MAGGRRGDDMPSSENNRRNLLRWRGTLGFATRPERITAFIVLAIACFALTFTQLGFLEAAISSETSPTHIVMLLVPVAVGALLLGTLPGAALGLVAGIVLFGHACFFTPGLYENIFVTPLSSMVMLCASGAALGLLFAFFLGKDYARTQRIIRITLVCIIASLIYNINFLINPAFGTNHFVLRTLLPALVMSLCCVFADASSQKILNPAKKRSLRDVFTVSLTIVVLVAFMFSAGVIFAVITNSELREAEADMRSDVSYFCAQILETSSRSQTLAALIDFEDVDESELEGELLDIVLQAVSLDSLLEGHAEDVDGTVLVLTRSSVVSDSDENADQGDYIISISNNEAFPAETELSTLVGSEFIDAIERSIENDDLSRFAFDGTTATGDDDSAHSEFGYLYAARPDEIFTVVIMQPSSLVFANRALTMARIAVFALVMLAVVFAMVFQLLDRSVVSDIDETNEVLGHITAGDLDARVEVCDTREFESLSCGINTTVDALKGWIAEAESRIDEELAAAKEIQKSALPAALDPFPEIERFDLFASMNAAREVGGDFYDFFLIGNDCSPEQGKLAFVIADVSDKGIPAALFMMKAMAQIRDCLQSEPEIDKAIEKANAQLCDGNDTNMFVTAWIGVLDYATGRIDFVNAGHNWPLLKQKGSWRWLKDQSGLALGMMDGFGYRAHHIECEPGDTLLLYTDGVTEAMNVDGKLYGDDRLMDLACESSDLNPKELVEAVNADVFLYAQGAEQSDDITVLALETR